MDQPDDDYDTPWKNALTRYFPEFMAFYFPAAHSQIDWSVAPVFLDQELAQLARAGKQGRRRLDKLARVATLDGGLQWVLIHVEVQGRRESKFAERIFTYNYRVYDFFRRPVASLAVLADSGPGWRPVSFGYDLFGSSMRLDFPVVKLRDYVSELDGLLLVENPFALITVAHLLTQQTKGRAHRRRLAKWRLAKLLYQRQWDKQRIIDLYFVIDWIMYLPEHLDRRLQRGIEQLERRQTMAYISGMERLGRERGLQEGRQEGRCELLASMLSLRFGPLDPALRERIAGARPEQIERWAGRLFSAAGLEEVFSGD